MSTRELVDALIAGDSVAIDTAFDTVMTQKVSANLDDLKTYVATSMFNPENAVEETAEEASSEEVE
jgi:hypothetical protein